MFLVFADGYLLLDHHISLVIVQKNQIMHTEFSRISYNITFEWLLFFIPIVTQFSTCVSGNVRLVPNDLIEGDLETQGIAEICILNQWRSVCVSESTINETLAIALCGILNPPVTGNQQPLLKDFASSIIILVFHFIFYYQTCMQ